LQLRNPSLGQFVDDFTAKQPLLCHLPRFPAHRFSLGGQAGFSFMVCSNNEDI
jgi:hypothetical protein